MRKFLFWLWVWSTKEKNSSVWCHPSGDFYAIYYSDIKKWKIKDGDYCELKTNL